MEYNPFITCPECDGTGEQTRERSVPMSFTNPYGYLEEYKAQCDNCYGLREIQRDD
jgi:DnaJ-class molecular chaperone